MILKNTVENMGSAKWAKIGFFRFEKMEVFEDAQTEDVPQNHPLLYIIYTAVVQVHNVHSKILTKLIFKNIK